MNYIKRNKYLIGGIFIIIVISIFIIINNNNKCTHEYLDKIIDENPTCIEQGICHYICNDCGAWINSYNRSVVKENTFFNIPCCDHNYTNREVTKEASCTEEGEFIFTCNVCGKTITETIPKLQHKYDEGVVVQQSTCSKNGKKVYTCEFCGITKTEITIKTDDHSYDNGIVSIEPTCTKDGERIYTCINCGKTKTEVVNSIEHNFVNNKCSNCGIEVSDKNVIVRLTDKHMNADPLHFYEQYIEIENNNCVKATVGVECNGDLFSYDVDANGKSSDCIYSTDWMYDTDRHTFDGVYSSIKIVYICYD